MRLASIAMALVVSASTSLASGSPGAASADSPPTPSDLAKPRGAQIHPARGRMLASSARERGLDVIGQGLGALGFANLPRVPVASQEGARRRRRARSGADERMFGSLLSCMTSAFSPT